MNRRAMLAAKAHPEIHNLPVAPKHQPVRVLLIEDSRSDMMLVSKMLHDAAREETFCITHVPKLSEALEKAGAQAFDIVLLDLSLPDADGVSAVSALCAATTTPVIVYSGTRDPGLRQQALMCGARHYLVKGSESAFSLRFMIQQVLVRGTA